MSVEHQQPFERLQAVKTGLQAEVEHIVELRTRAAEVGRRPNLLFDQRRELIGVVRQAQGVSDRASDLLRLLEPVLEPARQQSYLVEVLNRVNQLNQLRQEAGDDPVALEILEPERAAVRKFMALPPEDPGLSQRVSEYVAGLEGQPAKIEEQFNRGFITDEERQSNLFVISFILGVWGDKTQEPKAPPPPRVETSPTIEKTQPPLVVSLVPEPLGKRTELHLQKRDSGEVIQLPLGDEQLILIRRLVYNFGEEINARVLKRLLTDAGSESILNRLLHSVEAQLLTARERAEGLHLFKRIGSRSIAAAWAIDTDMVSLSPATVELIKREERREKGSDSYKVYNITLPDGQTITVRGREKAEVLQILLAAKNCTLDTEQFCLLKYREYNKNRMNQLTGVLANLRSDLPTNWSIEQPISPSLRAQGQKGVYSLKGIPQATGESEEKGGEPRKMKLVINLDTRQVEVNGQGRKRRDAPAYYVLVYLASNAGKDVSWQDVAKAAVEAGCKAKHPAGGVMKGVRDMLGVDSKNNVLIRSGGKNTTTYRLDAEVVWMKDGQVVTAEGGEKPVPPVQPATRSVESLQQDLEEWVDIREETQKRLAQGDLSHTSFLQEVDEQIAHIREQIASLEKPETKAAESEIDLPYEIRPGVDTLTEEEATVLQQIVGMMLDERHHHIHDIWKVELALAKVSGTNRLIILSESELEFRTYTALEIENLFRSSVDKIRINKNRIDQIRRGEIPNIPGLDKLWTKDDEQLYEQFNELYDKIATRGGDRSFFRRMKNRILEAAERFEHDWEGRRLGDYWRIKAGEVN